MAKMDHIVQNDGVLEVVNVTKKELEEMQFKKTELDNNYLATERGKREKLRNVKEKLEAVRKLKLEHENRIVCTKHTEEKRNDALAEKKKRTQFFVQDKNDALDELERLYDEALTLSANISSILAHLGLKWGGEVEEAEEDGLSVLTFTKVNPADPYKMYYMYFTKLDVKNCIFEVTHVLPSFKAFESMKKEMNQTNIVEAIGLCLEHWKRDISF